MLTDLPAPHLPKRLVVAILHTGNFQCGWRMGGRLLTLCSRSGGMEVAEVQWELPGGEVLLGCVVR
jgi:hypothetical protein